MVDPWGVVLARLARGPGVVDCEFDPGHTQAIRKRFPSLEHIRSFDASLGPHHEPNPGARETTAP